MLLSELKMVPLLCDIANTIEKNMSHKKKTVTMHLTKTGHIRCISYVGNMFIFNWYKKIVNI